MTSDEHAREARLDETIAESFPASDPPANTPETGVHVGDPLDAPTTGAADAAATDDRAHERLVITEQGQTAFLRYERQPGVLKLLHTEVPSSLRGRGMGERLVQAAFAVAHDDDLRVVVICPFVRAYLRKHPAVGPWS